MVSSRIQLPPALSARLQGQLKDEFDDFLASLDKTPSTSIRLNPGKPTESYASLESIPWTKAGRYLKSRPRFTDDPLFHAGAYYVQEASSMFLEHVLEQVIDLDEDHRVLDLSAAPGGKATHLQALLSPDSLLVANEIIDSRNKILRQNMSRWGGDNHIITKSDPKYFKKLPQFFDVILVDAPCSGEGLMRKDHQAIQEWSEDNVQLCSRRQKRILGDVLPSLAPGGILVYSTCTFSEAENEANMDWLEQESGLIPFPLDIPETWGVLRSGPRQAGHRFYPHRTRGEGFFIAAFRNPDAPFSKRKSKRKSVKFPELASADDRKWIENPERYTFLTRDEHRTAIPRSLYEDYISVSKALRITYSGVYLGKVYGGQLKPSPELAQSQSLSHNVRSVEFSAEQALDYLAHINNPYPDKLPIGYNLVTHQGHGLGWIHILKTGQTRNKYPTAWRILQRHAKS